jgi:hypothetical protein
MPELPECGSDSDARPLPTAECLTLPEVTSFKDALSDLIAPDAGPLLVRVQFGNQSSIQAVCTARTAVKGAWRARSRLASNLASVYRMPAGPACLAETRLDLNRLEARLAEIDATTAKCARDATARLQSDEDLNIPAGVAHDNAGRVFRTCLERDQKRRKEIWVFAPLSSTPRYIFLQTDRSAPRRTALMSCTDERTFHEVFDALMAFERDPATMVSCMQSHGWELLE